MTESRNGSWNMGGSPRQALSRGRTDTAKTTLRAGPRLSAGGQGLNGSEEGGGEGR